MRRMLVGIPIALILLGGGAFGLVKYRPDLLPSWARGLGKPEATEPASSPDEAGSSLEEDAPDDGWCAHLGKQAPANCKRSLPTIRLSSIATVQEIGLKSDRVEVRKTFPTVSGNAEISFVTHDYAHITSRVSGRISEVPKDEGQMVKKGEVLVVVDSAEVGTAKAQFLAVLSVVEHDRREFQRISGLRESRAASEKEAFTSQAALTKAEAELLNARQILLNMGFTSEDLKRIAETKDTSRDLKIIAPMSGRLVERHSVIGEAVSPPTNAVSTGQMQALFEIADLNEMWAWIDIAESDIDAVTIGQDVTFTISGRDAMEFKGHVELVSFSVNPTTRTVRVRAGLKNINERLRANQFGRAVIRVGEERSTIIVPRTAIQSDGEVQFVFIPQPDGMRFRTQRISTRPIDRTDQLEVTFGLKPEDQVVTTGSFLLKSELFKASLGGD